MVRVKINQGISPEDMTHKEPNKTKSLSFVSDGTNMYMMKMGGGMALLHCSSRFPGPAWDGMIFDEHSKQLVDNMILGLMWLKKNHSAIFAKPKPVKPSAILKEATKKPRKKR